MQGKKEGVGRRGGGGQEGKKLVFWLQKQQPSVFDLKCADTFFSLQESTQVFLMNNIISPSSLFLPCRDNFLYFQMQPEGMHWKDIFINVNAS